VLIFPVRHHSPSAALQVQRLVEARRPRAVLVEGPSDATTLIPNLLSPQTRPPVAVYAYRTGDDVRAAFYPFCAYSPEYAALKAGQAIGAHLAFCDIPAAATLAWPVENEDGEELTADDGLAPVDYEAYVNAVAEAAGFDSFEGFWEAAFEQEAGGQSAEQYVELLTRLGEHTRTLGDPGRHRYDELRERHMARTARLLELPSDDVLLVCGAAHATPIASWYDTLDGEADELPHAPVELALVAYSYPRLSEQTGYGAGNRAPWYYQQVWELSGDYPAATRRALVSLARLLRSRGHVASAAQAIDAYTLAATLASLRGKLAPGVDEVTDAATACFGQGRGAVVGEVLTSVLIGEAIGQVTAEAGRTPLQSEFYATAERLGLPVIDTAKQILVHLPVPKEAEQSVFLHRLRTATIPYAQELEGGLGGGGRAAQGGPLQQLERVREKWELQWTPLTDAQLVERTAWGSTLVEVCLRLLRERLEKADRIDDGTHVLFELALCDLADAMAPALDRCDALAADSTSFVALANAAYHLDALLSYGSARRLPIERLTELAVRLYERAVLALTAAVSCGDDEVPSVQARLQELHELVRRGSRAAADPEAFWTSVERVAEIAGSHPSLRGLALVLLQIDGRLGAEELASRLRYWLSAVDVPTENAQLIAGLFAVHRGTLVRDRSLITAVTDFLLELEIEQLTPLLPVLRRTLGGLSNSERAYLAETLERVLGLEVAESRRVLRLSSTELEELRAADAEVAEVLAGWRERYGIS
jgi:hypothetical protein